MFFLKTFKVEFLVLVVYTGLNSADVSVEYFNKDVSLIG